MRTRRCTWPRATKATGGPAHSPADSPSALGPSKAVRPVHLPQANDRRIGLDAYTGVEPGERSRAVGDRAQAHPGREMQEAMAGRDGATPDIDGHVAVQGGLGGHLEVEDLRSDLDLRDVRGPDRAERTGEAREPRAILRRMERLRGSGRAILRRGSRCGAGESGEREDRRRKDKNARRQS